MQLLLRCVLIYGIFWFTSVVILKFISGIYFQAKEIPGMKIVKYTGSLNFATIEFFMEKLLEMVPPTNDPDLVSRTVYNFSTLFLSINILIIPTITY